jgi:hypothetical protein
MSKGKVETFAPFLQASVAATDLLSMSQQQTNNSLTPGG